ncbi:Mitochondrial import receptor subunit TOM6-like protein, partial [Cucurbita argyrosperma subsp. argyrosperma]
MFPGMFMRKPDKAAALKQLRSHVAMFGVWVAGERLIGFVDGLGLLVLYSLGRLACYKGYATNRGGDEQAEG